MSFESTKNEDTEETEHDSSPYAEGFERRQLNVENVAPENYTKEMCREDMEHLNTWMKHEMSRFTWRLDELSKKRKEKAAAVSDVVEMQEVRNWHEEKLRDMRTSFERSRTEMWELRRQIIETYSRKGDAHEEDTHETQSDVTTSEKTKEKDELELAVEELGITQEEYKTITGRITSLDDAKLQDLVERVFGVDAEDNKEVRNAYYGLIKEFHPDTNGAVDTKKINDTKIKVVNNLYGEYRQRFDK